LRASENSTAQPNQRPLTAALSRTWAETRARQNSIFLIGSVVAGAIVLAPQLDQGWWPHDDGSLAQSAERVLAGELPHRDFTELYTGLLTFLNAGVFALAGEDLLHLRLPLFAGYLGFLACFFSIARRLVSPSWAFVATLFAATWSTPVFPVPIASWYLLFLGTAAILAGVRYFETRRLSWVILSGALGGVAVAVKVTAIWPVLAVTLALTTAPLLEGASASGAARRRGAIVVASAAATFVVIAAVLGGRLSAGFTAGLLVPVAILLGALGLVGWKAFTSDAERTRDTYLDVCLYGAGVLAPLGLFALPYVLTGGVVDLAEGVFVTPKSRLEFASSDMPLMASTAAIAVVVLVVLHSRLDGKGRLAVDVLGIAVMSLLLLSATSELSYSALWDTTRALAPVVVVTGAVAVARRTPEEPGRASISLLVILVGGFTTLIQFPFAAPVYFCYVAPLLLLAAIASMQRLRIPLGLLPAAALVTLVIFGSRQLDHQPLVSLGRAYEADTQTEVLQPGRASVRVKPGTKRTYNRLRRLVVEHRGEANAIFAGPDAPEVYFLTRSRNLTPALLDFLDTSGSTRGSSLLRLLEENQVPVVVLNHTPLQSPPLDPHTVRHIRVLYREGKHLGRFEVRWRPTQVRPSAAGLGQ
jgi:hypothetical protein